MCSSHSYNMRAFAVFLSRTRQTNKLLFAFVEILFDTVGSPRRHIYTPNRSHQAHSLLAAFAMAKTSEPYNKVRSAFNLATQDDGSVIPPFDEWRGISYICDHVWCSCSVQQTRIGRRRCTVRLFAAGAVSRGHLVCAKGNYSSTFAGDGRHDKQIAFGVIFAPNQRRGRVLLVCDFCCENHNRICCFAEKKANTSSLPVVGEYVHAEPSERVLAPNENCWSPTLLSSEHFGTRSCASSGLVDLLGHDLPPVLLPYYPCTWKIFRKLSRPSFIHRDEQRRGSWEGANR